MIVVDAEMSGLDPRQHALVSIGAVDFSDPTRQFYRECRIWEGAVVDPAALAVNGFTVQEITDPARPSEKEVMLEFIAWLGQSPDTTLAGQNTSYDSRFLQAAVQRHELNWRFGYRIVDLHSLCWAHMLARGVQPPLKDQRTSLNLDAILQYVGLPEEPKPHNGLTGAKMEAEAFSRLIHGRGLLDEYHAYPLAEYLLR